MNLRTLIMRRIVYVALLCLIAVAFYVMQQAECEIEQRQHSIAEALARQSEFQLLKINSGFDLAQRFPDWEVMSHSVSLTGLCAKFVNAQGATIKSLCHGPKMVQQGWPDWFDTVYRRVFDPGNEVVRQVAFRNTVYGKVIVAALPEVAIAGAWQDLKVLSGLSITTLAVALAMLYATISHALRPIDSLLTVLDDMANGNLERRAPVFAPDELQRIGTAVNNLAASLQYSLAERTALSIKLMNVQEQEREQLARDLHDEFGQHLAGINAMAAAIAYTARNDCPILVKDSENIIAAVGHLLDLLRGMLIRLRPPGMERMGLKDSLNSLVISWNTYSGGRTRIDIDIDEWLDPLPSGIAVHLYRIVQECLTNAAKHAGASRVSIKLSRIDPDRGKADMAANGIELTVEDNGMATPGTIDCQTGAGLCGMRERVAVLGGGIKLYASAGGGLRVQVVIPFKQL